MDTLRISVPLTKAEALALVEWAKRERRHPREQAAFVLRRVLIKRGLLPSNDTSRDAPRGPQLAGGIN